MISINNQPPHDKKLRNLPHLLVLGLTALASDRDFASIFIPPVLGLFCINKKAVIQSITSLNSGPTDRNPSGND